MNDLASAIRNTIAMVLAGGEGERLYPLTRDRAKPAVPFAGSLRLIDFTLSNCLNSGIRRVHVLTQYKSDSLNRHVRLGWNIFNPELGEYIEVNPPQMRLASTWYLGTADAIYQNIYTLQKEQPEYVLVLSGDHVYGMDYSRLIGYHIKHDADLTIACMPTPVESAGHLGVLRADGEGVVSEFAEKPENPAATALPPSFRSGGAEFALCSMGVYVFKTESLVRRVIEDSKQRTLHDFGRDVIPDMIASGDRVMAYRFWDKKKGRLLYWRDIGTLDAYLHANLEIATLRTSDSCTEPLGLYSSNWPFRSYVSRSTPLNIVCNEYNDAGEPAVRICNSLIGSGVEVRDSLVTDSVIGPGVHIGPGSCIKESVILSGVKIGRNVSINRAIVDKYNSIPSGTRLGFDRRCDAQHFTISEGGVVAVSKRMPLFQ